MKDDLDDAIDRAVREMMAVEPRPGMRQRVRARLEARRRIATVPRIAAVAAAAAVLMIVFMTTRSSAPAPDVLSTDARPSAAAPSTASSRTPERSPVSRDANRPVATLVGHPPAAPTNRPVQAASIEAALPADAMVRIAPIAAIDAIELPSLAETALSPQTRIVTSEITIAPIAIAPIEIPPLTEPR